MRRTRQALAVVLPFLSLLACSTADEVKCPPGYGLCGASCLSLLDDEENCGACGNACAAGQVCTAGACTLDCAASLRAPIVDRWGTAWDGIERRPATWPDAVAACQAIGGRLPTATESYRVSWVGTGDVGQSYQTNALWTLVPRDPVQKFAVVMSNGSTQVVNATPGLPYRCVCPPATPSTFSGYACNGPPGQPCFALGGPNAGYNMDAEDRARLSLGGALWECGFAGAQLPSFLTYAEAILDSLPNGSTSWLHTGDLVRYNYDAVVTWDGTQPSWPIATSSTYVDLAGTYAFRCVGRSTAPAPSVARPADAFIGATGKAADAADRAPAAWAAAQDTCWTAGGHLPFSTELGELVQQGLGGGTAAALWTADQEGYDGISVAQFLAGNLFWTGTERAFGHFHPTFVSWMYKTDTSHAYRCIYYPVDPSYVAPTSCLGGCDAFPLPGGSGATLWVDTQDRNPATLLAAIGICRGLGAHLATARDYTEMVRRGLANGSSAYLHAADLVVGQSSGLRTMVARWTNVDRNYDDQYSTYTTWSGGLEESRPFRCVWTNELR